MTWSLLAHNTWIILLVCVQMLIISLVLYGCAVLYNRAYMRLVRYYSQKEGTRND